MVKYTFPFSRISIFDKQTRLMKFEDISNIRLAKQYISSSDKTTPKDVVGYMCAMQAQDYIMSKFAVGARLSNTTEGIVESAIDKGEILRTHLLRPTWHLVSSDDIHWLLELSIPHIKSLLKSRHKGLEITETFLSKVYRMLEKELRDKNYKTRDEIVTCFKNAKIALDDNRAAHILMNAELEGLICSGPMMNKKLTYALLNERVKKGNPLTKDESLERLARKYFTSRYPATLKDFVWWSGLPVGEAKKAIEMIRHDFVAEEINSETYFIAKSHKNDGRDNSLYLLPAFDEILISYANRDALITKVNNKKTISNNGVFRPIIVANGSVIGIWRKVSKGNKLLIEPEFFESMTELHCESLKERIGQLEHFWGKKIEIVLA